MKELRIGITAVVLFAMIGIAAIWFLKRESPVPPVWITEQASADPPTPTLSPSPAEYSTPAEAPDAPAPTSANSFFGTLNLIIPVSGVSAKQLLDTFTEARTEGRTHDAIDIPAPAGTSVIAAADGEIVKLLQNERGGTTIYQISSDKRLVFYYAHLQAYAVGLREGQYVRQGDVLGYVGDTGNAGVGNFHLHFSIAIVADPKRYWEGNNINPYPLLHR